ncbi:MAG: GNAT family N-acetyltransferase [Lentisphaeria bacterium]|nr:GNAT family N-acetyltransferase [Lentisphaeria bacterium]
MSADFLVRRALDTDVRAIFELLEPYAEAGIVLRRSEADILSYIRNFRVALCGSRLCGCVAVRDFGASLLEVRSLVVERAFHGQGVGRLLVEFVINDLRTTRPDEKWHLFTLTGQPGFFQRLGFKIVSKEMFPEKIWSDCSKCPKQHCCDETALLFDTSAPEI